MARCAGRTVTVLSDGYFHSVATHDRYLYAAMTKVTGKKGAIVRVWKVVQCGSVFKFIDQPSIPLLVECFNHKISISAAKNILYIGNLSRNILLSNVDITMTYTCTCTLTHGVHKPPN